MSKIAFSKIAFSKKKLAKTTCKNYFAKIRLITGKMIQ